MATPKKTATTKKPAAKKVIPSQAQQLKTLRMERDLLEKKLNRLQDRYDQRDVRLDWIFHHPYRFALGRFYHLYVKRDQKL